MKITKLQASNFKRLVAVEITPEGNLVAITGKNGMGKSSVLDAITVALAGVRMMPDKPIRDGEGQARIVLDTDEYTITRKLTLGRASLEIKPKTGKALNETPQAFLDRIVGAIAFDPLAFSQMKDKNQRETLLSVLGLNLDEHDTKIERLRNERKDMMADKKRADDLVSRSSMSTGVPDQEVSITDLSEKLAAGHAINARMYGLETQCSGKQAGIAERRQRIAQMEKEIETLSAQSEAIVGQFRQMQAVDMSELSKQLAGAEETNRKVRANQAYRAAEQAASQLAIKVNDKYQEIQQAEADKSNAIGSAKLPVKGLGIDANGLTLDGIPFRQVNHAKRLEVSMAVAMAMNPELRVMLINGNGLDKEMLATITRMAEERDYQVWMEITTDEGQGFGIEIVDGMVSGGSNDSQSK
jgi:predicted ATP-dependent endonuclease of OLD family